MTRRIFLTVIRSPSPSHVDRVLETIERNRDDIYILCGGLGPAIEAIEFIENGYGIVNVYDDDFVIHVLKSKNMYIAGRWHRYGDICIGGIDAKNPVQSLERIAIYKPSACRLYIVISPYSLTISRCSVVNLGGRTIPLGLPESLSNRILSLARLSRVLYIACPDNVNELCIDKPNKDVEIISIPTQTTISRLIIDIDTQRVYIETLNSDR